MFHCLVIKVCCVCLSDSSFILSHLFLFVKHFFKFFQTFLSQDFVVALLTTWILYHIFCLLSTVNFIFLKFFLIVCFSKTIICDSSVIIPLGVMLVNHKIQIFWIFRNFIPKPQFNSQDRTPRVRFRPLQGSYVFFCRLEMSARGRGYRFGLLRRRGDTT